MKLKASSASSKTSNTKPGNIKQSTAKKSVRSKVKKIQTASIVCLGFGVSSAPVRQFEMNQVPEKWRPFIKI